jgi:alkylation response protein AidB-like acyl-CoA dehydrogenase
MALNPLVDSRDVRFILFELLEIDKLNRLGRYSNFDRETYEDVINLAEVLAINKVYPANSEADREHVKFDPATGEVKIPHAFKEGLDAYYEAGFLCLPFEESEGGMGMPIVLYNTVTDYFSAASMALGMFPMLSSGALNMYINFLPHGERRNAVIEKMLTGEWGGSMCLTEPDAGSDVGALKTKAVRNDDGTYSITGQKIFISNGDNDYYANNVHPVLARIEGDPAGTKGISIFMVPKYWINEDGSPGEPNDIVCSGIEDKMGIHGNPTCTLNFGDNGKCRGILMGEERKGMKIMFQMMNEARLFVGCQGMSLSSTAYMHSVSYARNRIQGKHVTQMLNPEAESVMISQHPDVKRMLLSMKSKVEAMRALTYLCGILFDYEIAGEGKEKEEAGALLEFLIPITKAGNTDLAWDVTGTAIQVYGGYGYCKDYPVEQFARDSKILSIYEGTNGIQSLDLTMRKLLMNENQHNYSLYKKRIEKAIEDAKGTVGDIYISNIQRGLEKIDEIVEMMKTLMAEGKFLHLFSSATPLQQAFSYLTYAWMHLWGLTVAIPKMKELVGHRKGEERENFLSDNLEAAFYSGRVLSGQYYLNSEFHKFFGIAEELLAGETAVIKASDPIFSGAPGE